VLAVPSRRRWQILENRKLRNEQPTERSGPVKGPDKDHVLGNSDSQAAAKREVRRRTEADALVMEGLRSVTEAFEAIENRSRLVDAANDRFSAHAGPPDAQAVLRIQAGKDREVALQVIKWIADFDRAYEQALQQASRKWLERLGESCQQLKGAGRGPAGKREEHAKVNHPPVEKPSMPFVLSPYRVLASLLCRHGLVGPLGQQIDRGLSRQADHHRRAVQSWRTHRQTARDLAQTLQKNPRGARHRR